MAEIKSISIKHNEIMDFLIANPRIRLGDVAIHFGITQAWLSQVIHSEIFQDQLKVKQDIGFHHTVLPIKEKLTTIAHQALDKITEELEKAQDLRDVKDVAADTLDRLGFGSKPIQAPGTQYNQYNQTIVLKTELEEARALLGKAQKDVPQALEVFKDGQRSAIALPAASATGMGSAIEGSVIRQPPGIPTPYTQAETGSKA